MAGELKTRFRIKKYLSIGALSDQIVCGVGVGKKSRVLVYMTAAPEPFLLPPYFKPGFMEIS